MKKLLIKKGCLLRRSSIYGFKNTYMINAGLEGVSSMLPESRIKLCYQTGGKRCWIWPNMLPMVPANRISLGDFFLDWQRPALVEDTLFEIETGYSLQKIFRITIPEDY